MSPGILSVEVWMLLRYLNWAFMAASCLPMKFDFPFPEWPKFMCGTIVWATFELLVISFALFKFSSFICGILTGVGCCTMLLVCTMKCLPELDAGGYIGNGLWYCVTGDAWAPLIWRRIWALWWAIWASWTLLAVSKLAMLIRCSWLLGSDNGRHWACWRITIIIYS